MTEAVLAATRRLLEAIAPVYDLGIPVVLWDGSTVLLGTARRHPTLTLHLRDAGVIPAILRQPKLDTVLPLLASGAIDVSGGTLLDLDRLRPRAKIKQVIKALGYGPLARIGWTLATARGVASGQGFDANGRPLALKSQKKDDKADIQFHYDISNDFYRLFLDERMVYSCAYFQEWHDDIDRAQADKLDMICRKLRLAAGDTMLDIGCGWGALLIHAARHYGISGDGVTLSEEQAVIARARIEEAGLADRITIHIKPYSDMAGPYDKISSIGMFEHVGFINHNTYFTAVNRLLRPGGLYLHHAITRRGRSDLGAFRRKKPEYQAMTKYIFPGGEVDFIGHTATMLEEHGFEVHDIEGWRAHYARTTKIWCERLHAQRSEAEAMVGPERVRIWLAYLAGVSLAFSRGSLLLFQTLASKKRRDGHLLADNVPASRADLYR